MKMKMKMKSIKYNKGNISVLTNRQLKKLIELVNVTNCFFWGVIPSNKWTNKREDKKIFKD